MDNDPTYYKDAVDRIRQFLKDTFADQFKAYFDGDPVDIPASLMPCMVVENLNSQHRSGPTGTDEMTETVLVKIVMNKQDDFGASPDADMTKKKLRRLVSGRDATTGQYLLNSLMGSLRTNITLGNAMLVNNNDVQYDVDIRPNDIVTSEAYITVTLRELVVVPNRV